MTTEEDPWVTLRIKRSDTRRIVNEWAKNMTYLMGPIEEWDPPDYALYHFLLDIAYPMMVINGTENDGTTSDN